LGAWKRELEGAAPAAQTVTEREELRRLRRENARLKLEQEILKKAMAFFANDGR
jgi:transposase